MGDYLKSLVVGVAAVYIIYLLFRLGNQDDDFNDRLP